MFNDVFWFFYMVHFVSEVVSITCFLSVLGIIVLVVTTWLELICISDGVWDKPSCQMMLKRRKTCLYATIASVLLTVLLPSERALYAGAGMYVAEQTEVTDTLMQLKKVVDQQVEELLNERPDATRNIKRPN